MDLDLVKRGEKVMNEQLSNAKVTQEMSFLILGSIIPKEGMQRMTLEIK